MKTSITLTVIGLICFATLNTPADTLRTDDTHTEATVSCVFTDAGLDVTFAFASDVSQFTESTLIVKKMSKGQETALPPKRVSGQTGNTVRFSVASSDFGDSDSIKISAILKSPGSVDTQTTGETTIGVVEHNRLQRILSTQPKRVDCPDAPLLANKKIAVHCVTKTNGLNVPGKIRVTVSGSGVDSASNSQTSRNIGTDHTFVFNLPNTNTEYTFKAEVMNFDDDATPAAGVQADVVTWRTTELPNPAYNVTRKGTSTDSIEFAVKVNQDVFAKILYGKITQSGVDWKTYSAVTFDPLTGAAQGAVTIAGDNKEHAVVIRGLEAGASYEVTMELYNKNGEKASTLDDPFHSIAISPPDNKPPFGFSEDPIVAKVTPIGIDVTWSGNDKAESATARYLRNDASKTVLTQAPTTNATGNSWTANFPAVEVLKVISGETSPILEVEMMKGGLTYKRRVQFSFALPTKAEVSTAKAALPANMQTDLKSTFDAIDKLIDSKSGNPKLRWQDILKAGISIIGIL